MPVPLPFDLFPMTFLAVVAVEQTTDAAEH